MSARGSRTSHRKQQMWVYVIAGLFVCDFVLCGYLPSYQRLRTLQRAQAQQHQVIEMAAARTRELAGLEQRLHAMENRIEGFDRRVPVDRAQGTFLQQIAGLMTDCGLVEQVVLPGTEWKTDDLNCTPIHVACHGTLMNLFHFFARLQALDRLVRIEKVALENDTDLTGRLGVQIEAVVFEQSARQHKSQGSAEANSAGGVHHGA